MYESSSIGFVLQATATSSFSTTFKELYNDTSFIKTYTNGIYAFPNIPAFYPLLRTSNSPAYAALNMTGLSYPNGASCGPTGYGFGCSLALFTYGTPLASTTLGNGNMLGKQPNSSVNTLGQISPSSLNGGFCITPNKAPMPRPPSAATTQAFIVLSFYMDNQTMIEV